MPRCGNCAGTAIDDPQDMGKEVARVRSALAARGLRIHYPVTVRLRTLRAMKGMDILVSPHQTGVTEMRWSAAESRATISMLAGMPALHFRGVFAHEYSHAFVFGRLGAPLPHRVEEGLAQYISYSYLKRDDGTSQGADMAEAMLASSDPIYGEGLRMVRRSVRHHGFNTVWRAIAAGEHKKVGLS